MCTGFVTVTACKYLMSDKCLHVLDLPDEAEGDSLTPYWFRLFTLDWLYYKLIHGLCRHFSEHLCADTSFFVFPIVGAGRSSNSYCCICGH